MRKIVFFDLFGIVINPTARNMMSKIAWMSLKQTNVKFDVSFEEFKDLEKRIKPIIVGKGEEYWKRLFKHFFVELEVPVTSKKVELVYDKLRTLFFNSCEIYPDFEKFINELNKDFEIILITLNKEDTVKKVLNKIKISERITQKFFSKNNVKDLNFFDEAVKEFNLIKEDEIYLLSAEPRKDLVSEKAGIKPLLIKRRVFEKEHQNFKTSYENCFINLIKVKDYLNDLKNEKKEINILEELRS